MTNHNDGSLNPGVISTNPDHLGLLEDLQAIQSLLVNSALDDDIPVLNEVVTPSEIKPKHEQNSSANPFLPEHIRKRLSSSGSLSSQPRQSGAEPSASRESRSAERASFEPTPNNTMSMSSSDKNHLVDELLQELMPTVKYRLRQKILDTLQSMGVQSK